MTAAPSTIPTAATPETPIGLAVQLRIASAMLVAGLIFWSIGWLVWQPADPRGPILFYNAAHKLLTVAAMAALSVVSAGLAVIVAGRAAALIAPAAVAFGLATLNLRGGEADLLGTYVAPRINGQPVWPTMGLVVELWLWLGLIALGAAVGRWVAQRAFTGEEAALDNASPQGEPMRALAAALMCAPVAYALVTIFSGSASDALLKQQIYFAVGAAFLFSTLAGQFVFRSQSAWWPLLSVGLVGAAAYIFGQPSAGAGNANLVFRTLPNVIARPLPIEFAAMGVIGGMLGLHSARAWWPAGENKTVD